MNINDLPKPNYKQVRSAVKKIDRRSKKSFPWAEVIFSLIAVAGAITGWIIYLLS